MQPLEKSLRNKLERTVKDARDIAETAARAVLEQIGVGEASPYSHLSDADKELRRKLRAHGRQLGDLRNATTEVQEISRLIEEVAYEHWHRMLFARFLAENNLLMYPDPDNPVPVTLEECEDLAVDEGAKNGWELAARFAARMLPQIFRTDSPVFQLQFAANHQLPLEKLLSDLPKEVFIASDSLGWVYQFWQAKRKDEVNASEVKIGARELPAVTQLFTEPYMVAFLLDNSLGAWWAARRLSSADLKNAKSEEELRVKASLPGVPLEYLRFIRVPVPSPLEGEGVGEGEIWTPAAGTFDGWPKSLKDLKTLDPCCGSGHFLVAAFLMLVAMRMELENLSAKDAVDAVLRENIHGLEIDQRCVELAAFALALTAWNYPDTGGYRLLPELNVACSGLSISAKKEEWLALARDNGNLRIALEELYRQFKDAPVLGSLINLEIGLSKGSLLETKWEKVGPLLAKALSEEKDDEIVEIGVMVRGIVKAAELLAAKYDLVITNVPYLAKGKQNSILVNYSVNNYPYSNQDLATVFMERISDLLTSNGYSGLVIPQNWLYQTSYKDLRKKVLGNGVIAFISGLGASAFEGINGWVVNIQLILQSKTAISERIGYTAVDVSQAANAEEKAISLPAKKMSAHKYSNQLTLKDYRISTSEDLNSDVLGKYASFANGLQTGDLVRFSKLFWEVENILNGYKPFQSTLSSTELYGGREGIISWHGEEWMCQQSAGAVIRGKAAWGKSGIAVSAMGELNCSLFNGDLYDDNTVVIIPTKETHMLPIWAYMSSDQYSINVRKITKALKVRRQLIEVPFDLDRWSKVAVEKYPNGIPKPYSDDPTQWIFHGHPASSDNPLQVAVARLLGYRWPAELDSSMELSDEARSLLKKSAELLPYADEDGIVCIPPVRGEMKAEDRLENLLAAAYGKEWSAQKKSELLTNADHAGKSMETWLRDKFFLQHCKLFQHRPFIWHIWDGLRDGFAALVNYHKLDHKNLKTLIYTYLGDWISRQKQDISNGLDGAAEKLAAAEQLKKRLELILEGEAPYDIFVRWKSLDKQPVGWNPDLNDGVRLNIRPFMTAGVLRFNKKPQINITWDKDRGKDVESAPWFKVFKGDRINDHHLSLEEKRAARESAK